MYLNRVAGRSCAIVVLSRSGVKNTSVFRGWKYHIQSQPTQGVGGSGVCPLVDTSVPELTCAHISLSRDAPFPSPSLAAFAVLPASSSLQLCVIWKKNNHSLRCLGSLFLWRNVCQGPEALKLRNCFFIS